MSDNSTNHESSQVSVRFDIEDNSYIYLLSCKMMLWTQAWSEALFCLSEKSSSSIFDKHQAQEYGMCFASLCWNIGPKI